MKTLNIHRLAGAMLLAGIMLTGCSKDNTLDERPSQNEETKPVNAVVSALEAIDGVRDVQMKVSQNGTDTVYYFYFHQPVNHANPAAGTYNQHVSLKFTGSDKDVVLLTHGYNMESSVDSYRYTNLAEHFGANQIEVEHRYFGNSLPEPVDKLNYTYLNADQQACDLHAIVQALKTSLFSTSKWFSTGTSKDGITSALYAYYSDQYGWDDIDVFVPFCAPFLPGSTQNGQFSCMDVLPGKYIEQVCGTGYADGSVEAVACKRLHDIPYYICTNKTVREACNRALLVSSASDYRRVVDQYNQGSLLSTGDLTKDLTARTYFSFYDNLFAKFSYVQFPLWAKMVPDPAKAATDEDELERLTTFIMMSHTDVIDSLRAMAAKNATKNVFTDMYDTYWNYLKELRTEPATPYYVQAFKELGVADTGYNTVDGTYLTKEQAVNVNYMFSIQKRFEGLYRQDEGKLMRSFRQWVATESTQNIIFVYAYNDPWTGGRPDDEAVRQNPHTEMIIDPIAVHNDYFLSSSYYTTATKTAIIAALDKFLK